MSDWFASRVRIARPTNQIEKVIEFYRDGIGLNVIGQFEDHDGYDGVILGMPDVQTQLEFTQHIEGSPGDAPSNDNLTVFYIEEEHVIQAIVQRLNKMGYSDVPPENPYWVDKAITIPDPDGWHVVLCRLSAVGE